jgi:hypothetical protein
MFTIDPEKPSCPFIACETCPYNGPLYAGGCPFEGMIHAGSINLPAFCPAKPKS